MAINPQEAAVFLKEVDEELRKDQINNFVARWGWALLAAAVLLIAAVGGAIWYKGHRATQRAEQAGSLLDALDKMEAGNRNAALPKLSELANSSVPGYRVAGLFARANAQIEQNQLPAAIATLRSIAEDEDIAEPYRQAALIRQTQLEYDSLPPAAVIQRLGALARPNSPWLASAGEMVAIAHMRLDQPQRAGPIFARIARDPNAPPSIRARALQMAGAFGIDATDALAMPGSDDAAASDAAAAATPAPRSEGSTQ